MSVDSDDARQCVVMALEYVDDVRSEVMECLGPVGGSTAETENEGDAMSKASARRLAKAIMRDMRSSLPVPAIFVALKVLHRLQTFAQLTADAFEEDEAVPDLPSSQNHVDFTVKQIWRKWLAALQKRASRRSDWEDAQWNYYGEFARALRIVVEYNTRRYFDISFYDDDDDDDNDGAPAADDETSSKDDDGSSKN